MTNFKIGIFVICFFFLMTACDLASVNNDEKKPSNNTKVNSIKSAKYVVGFSNIEGPGSEFSFYSETGKKLDSTTSKHGINLIMSTQNKNNLYFNSNRNNDFFKVNLKSGEIKESNEKSKSSSTEDEGSFFIETSEDYVFHDINVGYTEKGYESEFVYWKEEQPKNKTHIILNGMINSARVIKDKFYILTNNDDEYLSIYIVDPQKNKIIKEKKIPNHGVFFIEGNEKDAFQILDNKTLALAVADNINQQDNSRVLLINTSDLKVKKEIIIEDKDFTPLQIKVMGNQVIVPSNNGKTIIYDKDFKQKKSFKFDAGHKNILLQNIQFSDDQMHVLTKRYTKTKNDVIGNITTYNLQTGKRLSDVEIKSNKDWEYARFELLKN
ncbi:hypothetical protein [Bacillus atrophaeus]|uniref:hypothetical protein n=1 Tax=Bacillus atrophaeus TaxID=1452 RepID=UPI002E1D740A|nr:hypothetical protein [Bacillus atrophaeus]